MYAQHSYRPSGSRRVSLVAALVVNGAMLVGMATFVPSIVAIKPKPLIIQPIPLPQDPPTPDPTPIKPKTLPNDPHLTPSNRIINDPLPPFADPHPLVPSGPIDVGPIQPIGDPVPVDPPKPPPLVFHPAENDPRFAGAFQPEYPSSEIRLSRQGHVTVRVLIGTDGRVREVEQVSATSPAFFESTKRQALNRWRFKPATRGDRPEESWKTMNVTFVLNDGD